MAQQKRLVAFSGEDLKRRRTRALVTALLLVFFMVIVFVTTIFEIRAGLGK